MKMIHRRILSLALALILTIPVFSVPAWAETTDLHATSIVQWDSLPTIKEVKVSKSTTGQWKGSPNTNAVIPMGVAIEFTHPGIHVNAANLNLMRDMINQGYEPWASAFEEFRDNPWASKDYFNNNATRSNTTLTRANKNDTWAAYANVIMWWVTGDKDHYDTAIDIVRSYAESYTAGNFMSNQDGGYGWSAMIIEAGHIFQSLTLAAELLRYAEPAEAYANAWTQQDTDKFIAMLDVAFPTFDRTDKWMNQTGFTFQALTAAAVFKDDPDMYHVAIERATNNGSALYTYADASIKNQMRLVDFTWDGQPASNDVTATVPVPLDQQRVVVAEMSRDQPHAQANIGVLTGIAQTALMQDTKVNPQGQIQTDGSGTNLFDYLDERLLKGASYYYQYNLGYDVLWNPIPKGNSSNAAECPPNYNGSENAAGWGLTVSRSGRGAVGYAGILYWYYSDKKSADDKYYRYIAEAHEKYGEKYVWSSEMLESIMDTNLLLAPASAKRDDIEPKGPPQPKLAAGYAANTAGFDRVQFTDMAFGIKVREGDGNSKLLPDPGVVPKRYPISLPDTDARNTVDSFGARNGIEWTAAGGTADTPQGDLWVYKDIDVGDAPVDTFIIRYAINGTHNFRIVLLDETDLTNWNVATATTRAEIVKAASDDPSKILVDNASLPTTSWWTTWATREYTLTRPVNGTISFAYLLVGNTSGGYGNAHNVDWFSFGNRHAYNVQAISSAPIKNGVETGSGSSVLTKGSSFGWQAIHMDAGNGGIKLANLVTNTSNGKLHLYKGTPDSGVKIASYNIPNTGGQTETHEILPSEHSETITGRQDIYYVYEGSLPMTVETIQSFYLAPINVPPRLEAESYNAAVRGTPEIKTEDDVTYVSFKPGTASSFGDVALYSTVDIDGQMMSYRIRADGSAKIRLMSDLSNFDDRTAAQVRSSHTLFELPVIDTYGEWVTLLFDMSSATPSNRIWIEVEGGQVDLDFIEFASTNRPTQIRTYEYVEPVLTTNADSIPTDYLIEGQTYSVAVSTLDVDNDDVELTLLGLGDNAEIEFETLAKIGSNANHLITLKAPAPGDYDVSVVANDGTTWTTLKRVMRVFADLDDMVESLAALPELPTGSAFTPASLEAYETAKAVVAQLIEIGYTQEFLKALDLLVAAKDSLRFTIPAEADGYIDYVKYADSIAFSGWNSAGGNAQSHASIIGADWFKSSFLMDNSNATYLEWRPTNGGTNAQLIFDFGEDMNVIPESFRVQARATFPSRINGIRVAGSQDGVTWVDISTNAPNNANFNTLTILDAYVDRPFRYIRVYNPRNSSNANDFLCIGEFWIYGKTEAVGASAADSKADLNALIELAETLAEADYTPLSWSDLSTALIQAKSVGDNEDQIATAETSLKNAILALVRVADKTVLNMLIRTADLLDEFDYKPESWAELIGVLASAKSVRDNVNASQQDVQDAEIDLEDALNALLTITDKSPTSIVFEAGGEYSGEPQGARDVKFEAFGNPVTPNYSVSYYVAGSDEPLESEPTTAGGYLAIVSIEDLSYSGSLEQEFEITKKPISLDVATSSIEVKTYDGTTSAALEVAFAGLVPNDAFLSSDYIVDAAHFASADAGDAITVTATVSLSSDESSPARNYILLDGSFQSEAAIDKATISGLPKSVFAVEGLVQDYVVRLDDLIPVLDSPKSWGEISFSLKQSEESSILSQLPYISDDSLVFSFNGAPYEEGLESVATIIVSSGNFLDFEVSATLKVTENGAPLVFFVNFDMNGVQITSPESLSAIKGEAVILPEASAPEFTFAGWFTQPEGGRLAGLAGESFIPDSDITLYAHWTAIVPETFVVSFDLGGLGEAPEALSAIKGESVILPDASASGYIFDGWFTQPEGGSLVGLAGDPFAPDSDITLYAHWTAETFLVSFDLGGLGAAIESVTVAKGQYVILPSASASGYSFDGWIAEDGTFIGLSGESYTPAGNVTLYARWIQITPPPTYVPPVYYYPPYTGSVPTPRPVVTAEVLKAIEAVSPSVVKANQPPAPYAQELYKIGLFVGTGTDSKGNPTFELDKDLTRIQSLVLLIRLLGLEKSALNSKVSHVFEDVPDWATNYASFAYEIGLAVGINKESTLFAPEKTVTNQEFAAFLLRSLQYYEKSGDFSFEDSLVKAGTVGIFDVIEDSSNDVLRGKAVLAMVRALLTPVNKTNTKLLAKLVADGAVSPDGANGFIKAISAK
ncbi:MAG: InlB B-repeat-containing protein [Clostridiales bacterium]|jgi:uncharacterized repeat protein (TIGR02543 family)|nr:InlB B-repeat-containing protein [Clostridiales bacterium]